MDWLFPSIVATLIGTAVLAATYFFLYQTDKKRFLLIWTYAWCLQALRFIFMLFFTAFTPDTVFFLLGNQLSSLWSGVFLLWGTDAYLNRNISKNWFYFGFALSIYVIAYGVITPSIFPISLPVFIFLGCVYIWTGSIFLKQKYMPGPYSKVIGVLFIIWGLHKFDYPFLRPLEWLAPWGYVIGATLEISVAVSILMLYFQHAKKQIIESEEKYRLIVENQNELVVKLDPQHRIIYASPRYISTFGKTEKEHQDVDFKPLVHPEDVPVMEISLAKLIHKPHKTYHEERARTVMGWRWFAWSAKAMMDKEGQIKEVISVGRDIHDQKMAEKALRDSEAYMQSIFRVAPVGIGVVLDRVFLKVNDRFCDMLGYAQDELLGQNAKLIYPTEEEYDKVGRNKYDQIRSRGTGTVETRMKCKDGKIIYVLLGSTPIDPHNQGLGITFTALDITTIKHSEEALRQSEAKYRTMMEAIKDPVYICSQDHRIQYLNPAMIERVGYNAQGEFCFKALHGFDRKCPWCRHKEIAFQDHSEIDITSPKDNRSYSVSSTIFENEEGSFSKISVFRDITEVKKLQNQLQQVQKMEAIGNLAGGIAHDFNNILFPIIGLSELLTEDLPKGSLEYRNAQEILAAGKRGSDLVKQILTFSRQSELRMIPVWIQKILREVLKLTRSTIPSDIIINQDIQEDCGKVLIDPTQLHQIAMNLITNAYHAVEENGGEISIKLRETEIPVNNSSGNKVQPGYYAKLTVSDTGCGISSHNLDKIFDPYFTTKPQGKGTGLGLSVVYGIVKEYSGEIHVTSTIGEGTSFDVLLPLHETQEDLLPSKVTNPIQGGTEHILLIDDEEQIATLEKQILERLGYQVTSRTSSVEALEAFKSAPDIFDLVISDMTMPNLNGIQLAKELIGIKPDIPIIICTGFSERLDVSSADKIGVKGVLMKPIIRAVMAEMVRNVLDS